MILRILLFFITAGTLGCASRNKDLSQNNKLIAEVVLSIKLGQFQKARSFLNQLTVTSKGTVSYEVFNWEGYNPLRKYKVTDLNLYIDNLENLHKKEFLKCSEYIKVVKNAPSYRRSIDCLNELKYGSHSKSKSNGLLNKKFVSGSFYNPNSYFTPSWYFECKHKNRLCYPFGRIDLKISNKGPEAFLIYWANSLLSKIKTPAKIAEHKEKLENTRREIAEAKKTSVISKIRGQFHRKHCDFIRPHIVQKINSKKYEITYETSKYKKGLNCKTVRRPNYSMCEYHALLNTQTFHFQSSGYVSKGLVVKFIGKKEVNTENGFKETWEVFSENKECEKIYENLKSRSGPLVFL